MNAQQYFQKTHYKRVALAIALACVLGSSLTACGGGAEANAALDNTTEVETPALPVETSLAALGSVSASYEGTATLEPEHQATVVAKNTGVVLNIMAEEGDVVQAGQVLARLERDEHMLEVERAQAALERLENELNRATEMHSRQLLSTDEFDRVRFDTDAQRAALKLAQLKLNYTEIRAPIDGVISERMVKTGNLVSQHEAVFRIDDFSPLWAVLHVPERELNTLHQGQSVRLSLDAYPGTAFNGEVIRISPVVDPTTGTFKVTAEVRDDSNRIKPGLFGRVQIIYDEHQGVTLVAKEAVLSEDGKHAVFLVAADQSVTRQEIQVGYEESGQIEVISGLQPGDTVVTAGKGSLRDGAKVEVIE